MRPQALLLDDDLCFSNPARDALEGHGYEVTCVSTLFAACLQLDGHVFSLMVIDLDVDGLDVRRVIDVLSQRDELPPMLVVSSREVGARVAAQFGIGWIKKPIDVSELEAAIDVTRDFRIRPTRRIPSISGTMAAIRVDDAVRDVMEATRNRR
jgi:DNA-binding response OmpR family regulator